MPERTLAAGEVLIREGDPVVSLYELRSGMVEVIREGTRIAIVTDPGAMFGELSLLLDCPATATVRAVDDAVVVEIEDARSQLAGGNELALSLARLLAHRLYTMNGYLGDLVARYGHYPGGLGMVHEVLGTLTSGTPVEVELGSEREPDPT
jgi:CRP/FNR family cyclic AMP-dependent transcriptional regulator